MFAWVRGSVLCLRCTVIRASFRLEASRVEEGRRDVELERVALRLDLELADLDLVGPDPVAPRAELPQDRRRAALAESRRELVAQQAVRAGLAQRVERPLAKHAAGE